MSKKRVGAGLEGFSPVESIDTPEKNISCVDFVCCDSSCVGSESSPATDRFSPGDHNIHKEIGVVSGGVEKVKISVATKAESVSGGAKKVNSSGVSSSGDTESGRVEKTKISTAGGPSGNVSGGVSQVKLSGSGSSGVLESSVAHDSVLLGMEKNCVVSGSVSMVEDGSTVIDQKVSVGCSQDKPISCVVCGLVEGLKYCSGCKTTHYCSKTCQLAHWSYHAIYCHAVSDLERLEKSKRYGNQTVRQAQVDGGRRRKVLKLVGDKPKIKCWLNGIENEFLWDTGSMVTLVDRAWAKRYCPLDEILPVSAFLDEKLQLRAANSSEIRFDGVLLLDFGLEKDKVEFAVPVLVSSTLIAEPILGFNVIEDFLVNGTSEDHQGPHSCFVTSRTFQVAPLVSVSQTLIFLLR